MGHSLIMGYNTYLSITNRLGKTLPGRTSYVLTYESKLEHDAIIVDNLDELIHSSRDSSHKIERFGHQSLQLFLVGINLYLRCNTSYED